MVAPVLARAVSYAGAGTGQGFGFNFGRILAAIGTLQTGNLMGLFRRRISQACSTMSAIYLLGLVLICLRPRLAANACRSERARRAMAEAERA